MSDALDALAQQIAALEAALQLPLPRESRQQLTENLRTLHAQQAAHAARHSAIQGTTSVSGTLHGNAIGVNLGTVQTIFGTSPLAGAATSASEVLQEAIDDQRELLVSHRRTLAVYLKQLAALGSAYAPPSVANGIREARVAIRRAKASLHAWGVDVADLPDDEGVATADRIFLAREDSMADPITIGVAVITGLVGSYKAYTEYKAAVVKAQAKQKAAPAKTEEATKGEWVAQVVKAAVQQHGDDKDRNAITQFEGEPDDYREVLERKLLRLAETNPAFAQQLQTLAQSAGVQGSGVQGNVNVSGEGKVYGTAVGVNSGTISGTYNIGDDANEGLPGDPTIDPD